MNPKRSVELLDQLEKLGFDNEAFSKLHHFRLKNRQAHIAAHRGYCEKILAFRDDGENERVQLRLEHVLSTYRASGLRSSDSRAFVALSDSAFHKIPPMATAPRLAFSESHAMNALSVSKTPRSMDMTPKQLGDAGEDHTLALLHARGYLAEKLATNWPTYDIRAGKGGKSFLISVKVSREKQHVRLGTRAAVCRLAPENFVFAFMPQDGLAPTTFEPLAYKLLILPAELVQEDSLRVHDSYYSARGGGKEYSVMVKGYGHHHKVIWPNWLSFANAWHLLPQ